MYWATRWRLDGQTEARSFLIYEFSYTACLHNKFPVKGRDWTSKMALTNSQVLVLTILRDTGFSVSVAVYDTNGSFVRSFGEGTLKGASDITATNYGRVMVVATNGCCVHIFREDGIHLNKFELQGRYWSPTIAFHRAWEHVVIAYVKDTFVDHLQNPLHVETFTKDGEFVSSTQIHQDLGLTTPQKLR